MRKEFRELATVDEALDVVEELGIGEKIEEVALADANSRVVAKSLESPIDVPGFDRSKMDGYAVRAEDTYEAGETNPVHLEIADKVRTGTEPDVKVEEGQAVQISTGAVIPQGADAVVKVEDTDDDDDDNKSDEKIKIYKPVAPGDNVMPAGYDIPEGERLVDEGTRLTPRKIGLLSAAGI
ncbi:MAG: molybdopterin biosynthesis protein, partial [Halobacteria archaeon]|nr:molybdopterin biosynthesis protein [Halobacteria archaeon]